MHDGIYLSELFGPTIQGEGDNCGKLVYFIRLAGCDQKPACAWCDTMNAYLKESGEYIKYEDIIQMISNSLNNSYYGITKYVFTGGNPCIQNLEPLILMITNLYQYETDVNFYLETQGTIFPQWVSNYINHLTISPKPPSADNKNGQSIDSILNYCSTVNNMINKGVSFNHTVEIKIVVFNENDLHYAVDVFNKVSSLDSHQFSKVNSRNTYKYTIQLGTPLFDDVRKKNNTITGANIINFLYNDSNYKLVNDQLVFSNLRILPQIHKVMNLQ